MIKTDLLLDDAGPGLSNKRDAGRMQAASVDLQGSWQAGLELLQVGSQMLSENAVRNSADGQDLSGQKG